MATIDTHCEDCKVLLGESFRDVHEWLDEHYIEGDISHRNKRHNVEGIKKARDLFGSMGAVAATIHFMRDRDGFRPIKYDLENELQYGIKDVKDWIKH